VRASRVSFEKIDSLREERRTRIPLPAGERQGGYPGVAQVAYKKVTTVSRITAAQPTAIARWRERLAIGKKMRPQWGHGLGIQPSGIGLSRPQKSQRATSVAFAFEVMVTEITSEKYRPPDSPRQVQSGDGLGFVA